MPNKTQQFLTYLGKSWYNSIPLKSLWEVRIYQNPTVATDRDLGDGPPAPPTSLVNSIGNVLNLYENAGGVRKRFTTIEGDFLIEAGTGNNLSFLAQSISMPTDSFGVDYTEITAAMGGLRGGYYGENKDTYQSVTVSFLETNRDIFEFFFRPWNIAAGCKGLIEDGDRSTNIKANMDVTLYTKGTNLNFDPIGRARTADWQIRKKYSFEGVVPVSVSGEELNYEPTTGTSIVRDVQFTFKSYNVSTS
jgi:hypothetical protein